MNRRAYLTGLAGATAGFMLGTNAGVTSVSGATSGYGAGGYGANGYGGVTIGTPTPSPTASPTPTETPRAVMRPIQTDRLTIERADSGEILRIIVCDELTDTEICWTYE
jgi:hypothetical protein